ncbi:MAG: PRC-barrel domain-containing protein, partial [Devosia sp.]
DEQIGTIGDIVTNPDGSFDAVIVDVGGFLGLGAKPVAVGFDNLAFSADTFRNRYLFLNATREQLETQATYDPATYSAERESQRMVITP